MVSEGEETGRKKRKNGGRMKEVVEEDQFVEVVTEE